MGVILRAAGWLGTTRHRCRIHDRRDRVAPSRMSFNVRLGAGRERLSLFQRLRRPVPSHPTTGLTVYEVFLALTLLLGALAVLSQHIAVGTRASVQARLQTQAALLCETKLAEVLGGVEPMSPVAGVAIADAGDGWSWSLEVLVGPTDDLLDLAVTTEHVDSQGRRDASFSLRRLVRDPQVFLDAASASASSSTSGGSGS